VKGKESRSFPMYGRSLLGSFLLGVLDAGLGCSSVFRHKPERVVEVESILCKVAELTNKIRYAIMIKCPALNTRLSLLTEIG